MAYTNLHKHHFITAHTSQTYLTIAYKYFVNSFITSS